MKHTLIIAMIILLIGFVNADINCNPSSITTTYDKGTSKMVSVSCTNSDNSTTTISTTGETSLISTTETHIAPGTKTININLSSSASPGLHSGTLSFGTGYSVPIFFNVIETQQQVPCSLDIFPLSMNNIKLQQGEKKTRNIQLTVPNCFYSSVLIQGVALQTDERPLILGELTLGNLQPGNSVLIPIELNAEGVATGQYSDTLQFLLYNSNGTKINVPSVSISVLVSQGIMPISNFSLSDLPTCSLNSIEMNLNNTYKLTCSVTNPNIEIKPIINSKYIKGKSVQETSTQYIYEFQPILIGETSIAAEYIYKNAPLGNPFQQEIRISPSGNSPVSGTQLKVLFYQRGTQIDIANLVAGETILNIVDNKTDTLVNSYSILMGGLPTNNSINLEPNKNYNLRISSPGFVDLTLNFTVLERKLDWTINPLKEFYIIGDVINISSEFNDTSFLANDVVINNPKQYVLPVGNITIKAVKEGYQNSNKTIIVKDKVFIVNCFPDFDEWTKGDEVACDLNMASEWESYLNDVLLEQGNGKNIKFKIKDYGTIKITAEEKVLNTKIVEKKPSIWNPLNWGWVKSIGMWWLLIISAVIVVFVYYNKKEETSMGFATNITHPGG